ncbi:protein dehydratase [Actinobacillus delphinicola]|uniref:Flp pilus assembly protein n=1 Tax=Actinobacillus delphinicola TaxID=51161 RepID=A0A448TSH0_9PAST|nr:type II secretion system F family protein [Actinobacillus delphinicola]MDG6897052.1 protein dehydratase [Actinobacillus delphinicola]VEJ08866.1 Flp pilus assembly protein [Actinobacillus delphinicola]
MILYYVVLAFGVLLLLYTAVQFSGTKKKIVAKEYTTTFWSNLYHKTKDKVLLWKYYFVNGKPQNLIRNSVITLLIYMVVYFVNAQFIRFNSTIISVIYFLLFFVFVWKWGRRRNRKEFDSSFPEVIQVLNSATTAGAGLLQAIERCGQDVRGPFGEEFKYIYKRLAIGEDVDTVMADSYTRWPYREFYFFITILKINLEKGGQMKEIIKRLGRVIADGQKMEQKKKAMTSEARMSAMIVGVFPLFFFFFMKFQMPDNFNYIITDPKGRLVLYYVLGSESLGMGIIWWLMKKAT